MAFGLDGLVSGGLGFLGAEQQGDDMMRNAEINNAFNASQAAVNRDWQGYMSGTAYRRAVSDMKEAGLNPMLAYQQGGASTPGGGQAVGQMAGTVNKLGAAVQSASQVASIRQVEAQTDNIKADTENKRAENPNIHGVQGIQNATIALLREQAAQTEAYRYLNMEQQALVNQEIRNAVENNKQIQANTRDKNANAVLAELDAPRARNIANAQSSSYMKNIMPYTGEAASWAGSAAHIRRAFSPR